MATSITNTSISTDSITAPTVNTNTIDPTQGYLNIAQQNTSGEGGEINLTGSNGNANAVIDNNNGAIRILQGANTRIRVDTNGHVTMPQQPAFMAFKVGNQSVGTTTVQVTGWNNNLDIGGHWDNSQNRYTIPTAGIYLAGGFYQANQSTGLHFGIYKNGSAYGNDSLLDMVAGAANGYSVPFSMAANDYFTWVAYCSSTSTINANRSKIWVIKVA